MPAPDVVIQLVGRFRENRKAYQSPQFNETQLRREFLDPLFTAFGWDVENKSGNAEAYKDVIHEDAIKIGGATKAPDYCFRVGGRRIFFLEAKKPSVNVKDDISAAYQLRRYAWSAKLPLSILTDFEELALYDCRKRPDKNDKPSEGRVKFVTFEDYLDKWDELAAIFSKEAVLKGSFDRFAQGTRLKRGTAEVDAEFLKEIESWRELLARNFAKRNIELTQRDLNFAVQRTIDRLIFLRMCEDRGIEPYGQLQALANGENAYARLCQLFDRADDRYNSGLFHFQAEKGRAEPPDTLTQSLVLDDKPLKEILSGLYYPESPYEFSVLPAEILGQVYEQFLGKVIRLTTKHQAKVEDKPEVRKAGGVYYTPAYIVEYIVRNTVGKCTDGKLPRDVAKLRILDPACGSGSFLVGAYQFLLDWHRDWYVNDGPDKHTKQIYQGRGSQWFLTTAEKKRILVNSIFGVDIDHQAVEVTKLSLLLKVLENENRENLEHQLRLLHERALPDLGNNIKCGNSLIGPDFYLGQQLSLLDKDDQYRINVFDWQAEFPAILKKDNGGFDAVIGNPPWGQKAIDDDSLVKQYTRDHYPSSKGIYDLFRPFVEKGINLLAPRGFFGMVLPDIVLLKDYAATRQHLLDHLKLAAIDWWGMAFKSAVIDAATIIGSAGTASNGHRVRVHVRDPDRPIRHDVPQAQFRQNSRLVFNLHLTPEKHATLAHLSAYPRLGEFFEIHEGVHSGNIREELFVDQRVDDSCQELLFGRDEISPYFLKWNGRYIRLSAVPPKKTRERYANIGREHWHRSPKLLVRRTGDFVLAAVDSVGRFASNNFFLVFPKKQHALTLHGVCAVLNSRFITWFFRTIEPRQGRVFAELKIKHLEDFPLPKLDLDIGLCQQLNQLGADRAQLAEKMHESHSPHDHVVDSRTRTHLDGLIDDAIMTLLRIDQDTTETGDYTVNLKAQ